MVAGKETPIAEQYHFDTKVVYHMATESKGKSTSLEFITRFPNEGKYHSTEMVQISADNSKTKGEALGMTTVLDYGHKATITFMEQNKIAQVVPLDALMQASTESSPDVSIVKTGRTKKILDYNCLEYTISNTEMNGTMWITTEAPVNHQGYANSLNQTFKNNKKNRFQMPNTEEGFMMEMDVETSGKKGKVHMEIVEIKEEKKTYTLAQYQVMNGGTLKGLRSK